MHRILIGQKGSAIRESTESFGNDKVQVNFIAEGDKVGIEVEGPPSELETVKTELERRIAEIRSTTAHTQITVPSQYHSHLIGKGGSNLNKLKEKFQISYFLEIF